MRHDNGSVFSVLVVETDADFLESVRQGLDHARFPHKIEQASNYDEALAKLQQRSYDLVLSESELDNHNGLELLQAMNDQSIDLPFVLMADIRDDNLVREARKRGVSDIIIKSESQFHELAERLLESYDEFLQRRNRKRHSPNLMERLSRGGEGIGLLFEGRVELAHRDELTGLYNHGYLQDRIVSEFSSAVRYTYPVSCILLDIDHFQGINEKFGYQTCDHILKECAGILFDNCRMSDIVARYGGEEFAILLPHVEYRGAEEMAGRLRAIFADHVFLKDSEKIRLTMSFGIASFPADTMKRRCELLTFAAQALSRSKVAGRDTVTSYKDVMPIIGEPLPEMEMSSDKIREFQARMAEITDNARRAYLESSRALIRTLESKDRFTAGHAASTARYAQETAVVMGMDGEAAETIRCAALLHDIGKICIPDSILLKPEKLSFTEYEAMKQHAYFGYRLVKQIRFLREEAQLVLHHHEWWNGSGYPGKLKGEDIPLGARIIAVADSYDTIRMAGGRYKKTRPVSEAVDELVNCAGTQFDPRVVAAFIQVLIDRREYSEETYDKAKLKQALEAEPPA